MRAKEWWISNYLPNQFAAWSKFSLIRSLIIFIWIVYHLDLWLTDLFLLLFGSVFLLFFGYFVIIFIVFFIQLLILIPFVMFTRPWQQALGTSLEILCHSLYKQLRFGVNSGKSLLDHSLLLEIVEMIKLYVRLWIKFRTGRMLQIGRQWEHFYIGFYERKAANHLLLDSSASLD